MIIKQKIGGTLALYAVAAAMVAYAHSSAFQQAEALAKQGMKEAEVGQPVDVVLHIPEAYADEAEPLYPEQVATTVRTDTVVGPPLAVLIINDEQSIGGTQYQFLYGGDRVEILTDTGQLLAVVNGGLNS